MSATPRARWLAPVVGGLLLGCTGDPPARLLDTGWFDDTGAWDGRCPHRHEATSPVAGTQDWYWREPPVVRTASPYAGGYDAYLVDGPGNRLPSTLVWSEGRTSFQVLPAQPLAPATDHTLRVVDCEGVHDIPFRTSAYGEPLSIGLDQLQGRAYDLRIQQASWVEPGGVAPLLTLYFTGAVVVGLPLVTPDTVRLHLGHARLDAHGALEQDPTEPSTLFPPADFTQAPYFQASTPALDLVFSGARIPLVDVELSGTFSADGTRIGGGRVRAVGDTRFAGALVGQNRPEGICEMAAGLGVLCTPCPTDDQPLCLPVRIEDIEAVWVPGLVVQAL